MGCLQMVTPKEKLLAVANGTKDKVVIGHFTN